MDKHLSPLLFLLCLWQLTTSTLTGQAVRITDGTIFEKAILPILQERCMSCHGPTKAKGKLRLHTRESIENHEDLIIPGNLDDSELIYRIALPLNDPDDEKMPPSDEPNQMTADEIWLVKWWVYKGASYETKLSEIPNTDVGRDPLLRVLHHYALNPPGTSQYKVPPEPTPPPTTSPTPAPATTTASNPDGPRQWGSLYEEAIDPLFEHNCGKCHGESRASAKLRLHNQEGILAGGKNGPVLAAGNPKNSLMVERMHMPEGDDSRMPPTEENRQLKPQEIQLIEWWIRSGAKFDSPLSSAPRNMVNTIKAVIAESDARKEAAAAGPAVVFKVKEADSAGMDAVEKLGVRVVKRAPGSNALSVHCDDRASEINDQSLAVLTGIAPQIVWLNLAKTRITDNGLSILDKFTEVRRLHLDRTKITDAAIPHIQKLPNLEYLNLFGTDVSDAGIRQLASIQNLRKLYTAQTKVTQAGVTALKQAKPGIEIVTGLRTIPDAPPPDGIGTVVGAGAAGAAAGPKVDPTPVNTMCPIKPDRRIDPNRTSVFEGKTIGLCCGRCLALFDDNPSAYINKVIITRQPVAMANNPATPAVKPATPEKPVKVNLGQRTWTNKDGRTLQGILFTIIGPNAVINVSGRTFRVPITNLSEADQQYITQWKQAKGMR